MTAAGTQAGEPCPVCGLPDPDHDWDVHDGTKPARRGWAAAPVTAAAGILSRSSTRGTYRARVLAVHTTEGTSYTAAGLRDATWWTGSSHAIADARTLLTPAEGCVPYARASWTLRSGNPWSENLELVAMASWTRAQWLTHPGLLDNCARWLADRHSATGIPLVKLTPRQYRAGGSGVIGHVDHTEGYQDGSHWDPGPGFPWDVVLDKARGLAAGTAGLEELDVESIDPGRTKVLPIPAGATQVLLALDEVAGGANVRVAVGTGHTTTAGVYRALPELGKVDGFTGWIWNGSRNRFPLTAADETLTITHAREARFPLGVTIR